MNMNLPVKATERQKQKHFQTKPDLTPDNETINYSVYYYQDGLTVFLSHKFLAFVRAMLGARQDYKGWTSNR